MFNVNRPGKTAAPLRLMLLDDDAKLRGALRAMLEIDPGVRVVGEASQHQRVLEVIGATAPDLLLMDPALPGKAGVELVAQIRQHAAAVLVVVLSASNDMEFIRGLFGAGASGYVLKGAPETEIVHAIRAASAGRRFLCESVISTILARFVVDAESESSGMHKSLITEREREVLRRIALGQSNKHAARDLGLSVKTVEKHRSNLMRKLKLHNTAALTMFAIRHGVVEKDQPAIR